MASEHTWGTGRRMTESGEESTRKRKRGIEEIAKSASAQPALPATQTAVSSKPTGFVTQRIDLQKSWAELRQHLDDETKEKIGDTIPIVLLLLKFEESRAPENQKDYFRSAVEKTDFILKLLLETRKSVQSNFYIFLVVLTVIISNVIADKDNLAEDQSKKYLLSSFRTLREYLRAQRPSKEGRVGKEKKQTTSPDQVTADDLLPQRYYFADEPGMQSRPPCEYLNQSSCTTRPGCQWRAQRPGVKQGCLDNADAFDKIKSCNKLTREESDRLVKQTTEMALALAVGWKQFLALLKQKRLQAAAWVSPYLTPVQRKLCQLKTPVLSTVSWLAAAAALVIPFTSPLPQMMLGPETSEMTLTALRTALVTPGATAISSMIYSLSYPSARTQSRDSKTHKCLQTWQQPALELTNAQKQQIQNLINEVTSSCPRESTPRRRLGNRLKPPSKQAQKGKASPSKKRRVGEILSEEAAAAEEETNPDEATDVEED